MDNEEIFYMVDTLQRLSKDDPDFLKSIVFKQKRDKFKIYKEKLEIFRRLNEKSQDGDKVVPIKKGEILEDLVSYLLFQSGLYKIRKNIRNNTNEVDLELEINDLGNIVNPILPDIMKKVVLCECKNYNKTIDVTWIGKFYSLLKTTDNSVGIIFSYKGLTGKNEWHAGKGLIKKIFLKDGKAILNFDIDDFDAIAKEEKILPVIINDKYNCLKYQTDVTKYISNHPAEDDYINLYKNNTSN